MNYCEIKNCDIANGPGVRITLFVSGCRNHCPGCFQPQTWDFDFGHPFDSETEERVLRMLEPSYIRGITVLGGEPFEPENQPALLALLSTVRKRFPAKDVWIFTGFTWEELHSSECRAYTAVTEELISAADVIVDGRFVEEKKNIRLRFRGSENQRIIDVRRSVCEGTAVLWEDENN